MKNKDVNRMHKALRLNRYIVGVKFLYFEHEYKNLELQEYGRKTSYCMMVKHAMEGNHFKAALEHFACRLSLIHIWRRIRRPLQQQRMPRQAVIPVSYTHLLQKRVLPLL